MASSGSGGSSGGGSGGGSGGAGRRRIVAGSIVYKFEIEVDNNIQAQLQAQINHSQKLLQDLTKLSNQYKKTSDEGEGGFKALNLAVAGFFALIVKNSTLTKDMFGALFTGLGAVMDSIAMIFLPLVTKLVGLFTTLATHILGVTTGTTNLKDAFEKLGNLVGQGAIDLTKFSIKFAWDLVVNGVPNFNKGIREGLEGLPPLVQHLVEMLIETGAGAMIGKLGGAAAKKMGFGSGLTGEQSILFGLAAMEGGNLLGAVHGDKQDLTEILSGGTAGLIAGLATKNPEIALGAVLGGDLLGGTLYDMMNGNPEAEDKQKKADKMANDSKKTSALAGNSSHVANSSDGSNHFPPVINPFMGGTDGRKNEDLQGVTSSDTEDDSGPTFMIQTGDSNPVVNMPMTTNYFVSPNITNTVNNGSGGVIQNAYSDRTTS